MPTTDEIFLGAYATEQDALAALAERAEPPTEMTVVNDSYDATHPWRIKWVRTD